MIIIRPTSLCNTAQARNKQEQLSRRCGLVDYLLLAEGWENTRKFVIVTAESRTVTSRHVVELTSSSLCSSCFLEPSRAFLTFHSTNTLDHEGSEKVEQWRAVRKLSWVSCWVPGRTWAPPMSTSMPHVPRGKVQHEANQPLASTIPSSKNFYHGPLLLYCRFSFTY